MEQYIKFRISSQHEPTSKSMQIYCVAIFRTDFSPGWIEACRFHSVKDVATVPALSFHQD